MSDYFNETGTIGFTCDVCGREIQGCTWVNGMRFCAKCYQETFVNTNPFEKELRDKIADLEAKLAEQYAEVEKVETHYIKQREYYTKEFNEIIDNLKEKLAESEKYAEYNIPKLIEANKMMSKQLSEKNKEIKDYVKVVDDLHTRLSDKCDFCEDSITQAKTDFAIERLEKVKGILEEDRNKAQALLDPIEQEDYHELVGVIRGYRNSIYEVQKQIKKLKEGK